MVFGTVSGWEGQSVMTELDSPAIDHLGEIRAPTLTIVGNLNMPGIQAIVDRIMKDAPGAEKVVIPGTARMLDMEKPSGLTGLLSISCPGY